MYTLGIETSCDETSCAVVKGFKVLANATVSSLKEHVKYGGVVPEIAHRAHLENIDKVLLASLKESGVSLRKIGLIAVTSDPGLAGALVVGVNFAKALALGLNKPVMEINHLKAHLLAAFLDKPKDLKFPFIGLVISGGHTDIYLVRDFDRIKKIGSSFDDACGEVYDKVARALGLGYPGGPIIDKLYREDRKNTFDFHCGRKGYNLSFSGIKTAVIYKKIQLEKDGAFDKTAKINLVSSFQHSVIRETAAALDEACRNFKINRVVCGGGVAANSYLRRVLLSWQSAGREVIIAPLKYCGDNAAMVAGLGSYLYNKRSV
jgi:N6-L-threonylcarbamoyladenine synthase